ncbi:MAG TPA: beta-ketoacyl-ACP synthase II [Syntrophomonadaceae bacterium]|nr:beta-ketoacyl-ACP synthase II [Syntrophomonadaceae bacterium]
MHKRRVVVSGMGLVTAIGNDLPNFWDSLLAGRSGVGPIDRFDVSAFPTRIAAQVKNLQIEEYVPRKDARRMDLFVQYACAAARMAVENAGLQINPEESHRIGVWIGSGIGGLETLEKQHTVLLNKGPGSVSPFLIPMMIPNMAAGQVAIMLGTRGPNGCTVTACASGSNSIGEGFQLIQLGKADVMICGGTEASVTPVGIGGFCSMKAMSTLNDDPQKACKPFDLNRSGFVMGEGSGIIILEELDHALQRGAKIYAELLGYGASADANHIVQPDPQGRGAALAFRAALTDAGLEAAQVDYINAHGTGTQLNDAIETDVIKDVFGEHSRSMLITSTKSLTGHMLGAGGAVELVATIQVLNNNLVPPTANLETPDPHCDLDYVPGAPRTREIRYAMSDSLGFGGHNAVLAVGKYS